MNTNIPPRLRMYIKEVAPEIAKVLDFLWFRSKDIHDRMNLRTKPPANESGLVHVQMVEYNLWRLLNEYDKETGDLHIKRFEPYELFLMSAAACCHDFDKAKMDLPEGYEHGEYSGEIVVDNHEILGLSRQQANSIKKVIEIHDKKNEEFVCGLNELTDDTVCPLGTIQLRLIATLLKTADILHSDESRISTLVNTFTESSGLDRFKYLARSCTDGWKIHGPKVVVVATPNEDEQELAFRYSFSWMKNNEWNAVTNSLREYRFPHLLEAECHYDSSLAIIEIIVNGNVDEFNEETFASLQNALMCQLSIAEDKVSVITIFKGSIIIVLAIPIGDASRLKQLAQSSPNNLILAGAKSLCFEDGTEIIFDDDNASVTRRQIIEDAAVGVEAEEVGDEVENGVVDQRIIDMKMKEGLLGELLRVFPRVDRFLILSRFYNISIIKSIRIDSPMNTYMDFISELWGLSRQERRYVLEVLKSTHPGSDFFDDLFNYFNN